MGITAAKAVNDLVNFLNESLLITGINKVSGKVYPFHRPLDSKNEDIVVNSLVMTKGQVQDGMLNVNIYVPNRKIQVGQAWDNTRPNMPRISTLNGIASDLLEETYYEDGNITFEAVEENIFPDNNNQHYINFRIKFTALNI